MGSDAIRRLQRVAQALPDEDDSDRFAEILGADNEWVCARHTRVEVRRTLARELDPDDVAKARTQFETDWDAIQIVELDDALCELACDVAETTGARTLDALHLAAAHRVGGGGLTFLTADLRQAQIARSLGWTVLGA